MPFYYRMPDGAEGQRVAEGLLRLRHRLDRELPARTREKTLLLATWNIREFDSTKYGRRMPDAYLYMAEIVSRFDLVAIQEVRSDLSALERLQRILGDWWKFLVTDVTEGRRGNKERMAFLYDARKVRFGGLAGEVVIPPVETRDAEGRQKITPAQQLYRTPYMAAFQTGWFKFLLATVHILYGKGGADSPERVREIEAVAGFLADRVADPDAWSSNLILLGDFNIFGRGDPTFRAITDAGFSVPEALQSIPGSNVSKNKAYDQIAFSTDAQARVACSSAGVFDFFESVYRDEDEETYVPVMGEAYRVTSRGKPRANPTRHYKQWRTHQMSDHLPMWIELEVDFGEEYLKAVAER